MKYQYHQIYPGEIENVLQTHPDVLDVAVVPVPHEIDIERPMAYVRKVPGSKVNFIILFYLFFLSIVKIKILISEIRNNKLQVIEEDLVKMSSTLGKYKTLWGGVVFLNKIPTTPSGKIMRRQLIDMAKHRSIKA